MGVQHDMTNHRRQPCRVCRNEVESTKLGQRQVKLSVSQLAMATTTHTVRSTDFSWNDFSCMGHSGVHVSVDCFAAHQFNVYSYISVTGRQQKISKIVCWLFAQS